MNLKIEPKDLKNCEKHEIKCKFRFKASKRIFNGERHFTLSKAAESKDGDAAAEVTNCRDNLNYFMVIKLWD